MAAAASAELTDVGSPLTFVFLPREIRDQIYRLLFLARDRVIYPNQVRAGTVSEAINFLRTSHQVYSEAVLILYGQNTFQIRGDPAFKAPELLNNVIFQRKKEKLFSQEQYKRPPEDTVCLGRYHLKRLHIPSHGISLDRLKHLFSLLKYFPALRHVQVIYLGRRDLNDMEVVNVCRLLTDQLPLLKTFVLGKRISYAQADDISWMIEERKTGSIYRNWKSIGRAEGVIGGLWEDEYGEVRRSTLMEAPQNLPE